MQQKIDFHFTEFKMHITRLYWNLHHADLLNHIIKQILYQQRKENYWTRYHSYSSTHERNWTVFICNKCVLGLQLWKWRWRNPFWNEIKNKRKKSSLHQGYNKPATCALSTWALKQSDWRIIACALNLLCYVTKQSFIASLICDRLGFGEEQTVL